jgi:hypothetical protein
MEEVLSGSEHVVAALGAIDRVGFGRQDDNMQDGGYDNDTP